MDTYKFQPKWGQDFDVIMEQAKELAKEKKIAIEFVFSEILLIIDENTDRVELWNQYLELSKKKHEQFVTDANNWWNNLDPDQQTSILKEHNLDGDDSLDLQEKIEIVYQYRDVEVKSISTYCYDDFKCGNSGKKLQKEALFVSKTNFKHRGNETDELHCYNRDSTPIFFIEVWNLYDEERKRKIEEIKEIAKEYNIKVTIRNEK